MVTNRSVPYVNAKLVHRRLGKDSWNTPVYAGPEKYFISHKSGKGSVIVSIFSDLIGINWIHASIAWPDRMPTYEDLKLLHYAVFGKTGWSYQAFAPETEHVNIHEHALHLWGRVDGSPALPDFASMFEHLTGIHSV